MLGFVGIMQSPVVVETYPDEQAMQTDELEQDWHFDGHFKQDPFVSL